jgi:CheY-like chemotaxis protein
VRVLALDDDRQFLDMLRSALEEEGHQVSVATNGEAALAMLRHLTPDVILLDVRMPRMDGRSFARAYARRPGPHAPLVIVSGAAEPTTRDFQAAAYVSKPFELDVLLRVLRELRPVA